VNAVSFGKTGVNRRQKFLLRSGSRNQQLTALNRRLVS